MPFAGKFLLCIILSLLLTSTILLLGTDMNAFIRPSIISLIAACLFITPYILLPVWEYRERKHSPGVSTFFDRTRDAVAYLTGFCVALFGWKKIFHLQFRTPLSIADLAMSGQTGETLTWYYFGHSQVFGYIIAMIQILGSALLFFKRTRIAALLLLVPVMLNITLINIFYQMNAGALVQSVVLTVSLVYLLLQYWPQLLSILLITGKNVSPHKKKRQWMIAALGIFLPFLFIFLDSRSIPKESPLYGEYEVTSLSINGKHLPLDTRRNSDSILTKVYFDMSNVCVLEYNSPDRRLIANYTFDEEAKILKSTLETAGKQHLLHMLVAIHNNQPTGLTGKFGNDSLQLLLHKVR